MRRRDFLKNSLLSTGIICSRELNYFPFTSHSFNNKPSIKHVILCTISGGIRNLESVHKNEGNLMPGLLFGNKFRNPIRYQGTLFKEFRYSGDIVGHWHSKAAVVTGNYLNSNSDMQTNPVFPTPLELCKSFEEGPNLNDKPNIEDLIVMQGIRFLKKYHPGFMMLDFMSTDIAHKNFKAYSQAIQRTDAAITGFWNYIQSDLNFKNNTAMIVLPTMGRNEKGNTIHDCNNKTGLDHSNQDPMSREIFCLVAGPKGVIRQNNSVNGICGESIDIVPTIQFLFGHDNHSPNYLPGRVLKEALC